MWLLLVCLLTLLVTWLVYYSTRRLQYFSSKGVPTLRPVPFLGNLAAATLGRENIIDAVALGYQKFKHLRYFGFYQYLKPIVIANDPEMIHQIMVNDYQIFYDRGLHIDPDPLVGQGLIFLKGSKWKKMREVVTPALTMAKCRNMVPLMADCSNAAIDYLQENIPEEGKLIDTNEVVMRYLNDVIANCAFGFAVNSFKDPDNFLYKLGFKAIVTSIKQILTIFISANIPTITKLMKVKLIATEDANLLQQLFKNALKARREKTTEYRPDFIQSLVNVSKVDDQKDNSATKVQKTDVTEDDLVSQAVLFYVAGYDTTSNLVSYFLHEMALNPDVQDKLCDEIDKISMNHQNSDLYETIQKLEYLDMCVSETLRKWPLAPLTVRESVSTYDFGPTQEGSHERCTAEPGITVWIPIYLLHRDEKYWPNPLEFIPERFNSENKEKILPYTYLPFGAGAKHCIGSKFALVSTKVFLFQFFRKYRTLVSQVSSRLAPVSFILAPVNGFNIVVKPRCINQI